jgi:hypothetical protein
VIVLSEWGQPEDYIDNRGKHQDGHRTHCSECGRVVDASKIKR